MGRKLDSKVGITPYYVGIQVFHSPLLLLQMVHLDHCITFNLKGRSHLHKIIYKPYNYYTLHMQYYKPMIALL